MKALVLNGPNLDRLGTREPEIYGRTTLPELEALIAARAAALGVQVTCFQTADPAALIARIERGEADVIIINPASLTHHSIRLRDALRDSGAVVYEVHISNIAAREPYRRRSLIAPIARGSIVGCGITGYLLALEAAVTEAKR